MSRLRWEFVGSTQPPPPQYQDARTVQASAPPVPITGIDEDGFSLASILPNGGHCNAAILFCLAFALRAAYRNNDAATTQVSIKLGCNNWRKLAVASVLSPNIFVFETVWGRMYVVQGTTNIVQWANYLWAQKQVATPGCNGLVFEAFHDASQAGGYAVLLNDILQSPRGSPVMLLGHSLGASLAEIWARRLARADGITINGIMTFGSPRTGNRDFARQWRNNQFHVWDVNDPVTRILPSTYWTIPVKELQGFFVTHLCEYEHTPGLAIRVSVDDDDFSVGTDRQPSKVREAFSAARLILAGDPGRHSMANYGTVLRSWGGPKIINRMPSALANSYLALHAEFLAAGF